MAWINVNLKAELLQDVIDLQHVVKHLSGDMSEWKQELTEYFIQVKGIEDSLCMVKVYQIGKASVVPQSRYLLLCVLYI